MRRGVDGFRVDVIKDELFRDDPPNPAWREGDPEIRRVLQLYSTDRPEVQEVVRELRRTDEFDQRLLIGEIYLPVERLVAYYGENLEGAHLPFNFQLIKAVWNVATTGASSTNMRWRSPRAAGLRIPWNRTGEPWEIARLALYLAFEDPDYVTGQRLIIAIGRNADHLYIEAAFLEDDAGIAAARRHLNARRAGELARKAGAKRMTVFHHSQRYLVQRLRLEVDRAFRETKRYGRSSLLCSLREK